MSPLEKFITAYIAYLDNRPTDWKLLAKTTGLIIVILVGWLLLFHLVCGCSFDEARQMQQRAYMRATSLLPANVLSDIETYFERECDDEGSEDCGEGD